MAAVHVIEEDSQFQPKVDSANQKLVVVDFNASWCGPCRTIAPVFAQLAGSHPNALFLKVDVDACTETAQRYSVTAMPTFIFLKGGVQIDMLKGADPAALTAKVKEHYVAGDDGDEGSGVPGYIELNNMIDKQDTECLNESDDHHLDGCLKKGDNYLESDCDEQLIIKMSFQQNVKLHSLKLLGPSTNGPKVVKLFINQPQTLDFDAAERMEPIQKIILTPEQLAGEIVPLRFVKFQNVHDVTVFVLDNQDGEDTTVINYLSFIGVRVNTTNMNEFKRVAGKKGESH
nr:thioredoxin-like protein 1 [Lytechinus pictus]